ncbi:MAG TPA: flagellar export protein FliJ [Gammaproteobacteria bacterium]|nr:flagellar export protein FliJ [Gammaproteobacteria bacterium]
MNKAVRLEPLADYAGKVENEAARRLAACAQALSAKEKEVEGLRGYLAEYRQRAELTDATTDPMRWQNTRAFLAKLSEVVAAREAELVHAVELYRLETERWRDSHVRAKSLDKIVANAAREVLVESAKREQRELDERALWQVLERS